MVQLFYYETRGKCCRKFFSHEGVPTKIHLFPYEGWAQPALSSYWTLKTYWWSRTRVKITEVAGSQKHEVKGKVHYVKNGSVVISGKIKDSTNADFRMNLTSNVSNADFQLGYCITGTLERGDKKCDKGMTLTHFAMIKRRGWAQPALSTYWTLKTYWWGRTRVKITEVAGSQKHEVKGKVHYVKNGSVVISGKIKDSTNADFRMNLTSNVSNADFQLGYCITGTFERGDKKCDKGMTLTHFAMIKRRGY